MDGRNFSPIYRTLSPVWAATQKEVTKSFKNITLVTPDQLFSSCFFWEKCQYICVFGIPKNAQGDFFFFKEIDYKYVHLLVVIKH